MRNESQGLLSYKEIRAQICDVCHKMWQLGWVASNDGNVSVKLSDGTFLATPTGVSKSMVTPEMIVHINKAGEMIETVDGYRPSSEMRMHFTLKGQISLCLAAFFLALAGQIFLSFYQSGTVLRELDDQMGNFNAISRFQNGVELFAAFATSYP